MSGLNNSSVQVLPFLGVFCELQKASESGAVTVEQLLQISRHYRAIIHICVMELKQEETGVLGMHSTY